MGVVAMAEMAWTPRGAHGFARHAEGYRPTGRTRFPDHTSAYVPPGWPTEVQAPGSPEWEASAAAFLLDCCPADYRGYPVLRRHPVILARFATAYVESQLTACHDGLGEVRASLGPLVEPPVLEAALAAWHEQGALLRRRRREVGLVEDALRGAVFVKKL
jgi:hypothetical protein